MSQYATRIRSTVSSSSALHKFDSPRTLNIFVVLHVLATHSSPATPQTWQTPSCTSCMPRCTSFLSHLALFSAKALASQALLSLMPKKLNGQNVQILKSYLYHKNPKQHLCFIQILHLLNHFSRGCLGKVVLLCSLLCLGVLLRASTTRGPPPFHFLSARAIFNL